MTDAWELNDPKARVTAIAALNDITRLMYRLNVMDHLNLVTDDSHEDSVYRHLTEAGAALCRQLGWPVEDTMEQLVSGQCTASNIANERGEFK